MADENVRATRDWFTDKHKENAREKNVNMNVSWRDIARRDASELVIESGGKIKMFPIDDFKLISLPGRELEEWIKRIIDSLA